MRTIVSQAPTRVDLAGGTLDIWPLYLFLKKSLTLNLGISLFAETTIEETKDPGVKLQSLDQGAELSLTWDQVAMSEAAPALQLHLKLLQRFLLKKQADGLFNPKVGIKLSTSAKSPAGAGLGGSSALSVSMVGALASWAGPADHVVTADETLKKGEAWIDLVRDVETTVIQVPAGLQDYYGAMFGGLQSLKWLPGRHERSSLDSTLVDDVQNRLLLFYSGQSRNSGINNWALYKAFIDRQDEVRERFQRIADATNRLEHALRARAWDEAAAAIADEWDVRRTLARGISTPELDYAFSIARKHGVFAGKICGAGGGGCFFLFIPSGDLALRERLASEISSQGVRRLDFTGVKTGLNVKVEHRA